MAIGGGILAIGVFGQTHGYLQQESRDAIRRWELGGPLGSSYDGYLQQEAKYAIARLGLGGQSVSFYDGYLQEEASH